MRKLLLFGILLIGLTGIALGQAPKAFKYQAIARDAEGMVVADQAVSVEVTVVRGSADGPNVYVEEHIAYTNSFGLINLEIGSGTARSGSFRDIDWGNDSYYIRIGLDVNGGSDFEILGTAQLLSVPYALYAENSGNSNQRTDDYDWGNHFQDIFTGTGGDYPTGNVGIGITTPQAKLHVIGTTLFDQLYIESIDSTLSGRVVKNRLVTSFEPNAESSVNGTSFQIKAQTEDATHTNGYNNQLNGLKFSFIHKNNGTVNDFYGMRMQGGMPSGGWGGSGTTGTINNLVGFQSELYSEKGTVNYAQNLNLRKIGDNFTNYSFIQMDYNGDLNGNYGIYNNSTYDNFFNGNVGILTSAPAANLDVNGSFALQTGVVVNEISNDTEMLDDSPTSLVTEHAAKTYIDDHIFGDHLTHWVLPRYDSINEEWDNSAIHDDGTTVLIERPVDLNDALDVSGITNLAAAGVNTQVRGTLGVTEGASFSSSLDVDGTTSLDKTLISTDEGKFYVDGSSSVEFDVSNTILLNALGNSNFSAGSGTLTLEGSNGVLVGNSGVITNVRGALVVDQYTHLKDSLAVDGVSVLNNKLNVIGITTLENTTESNTYADGALVVEGGVGIAKNLNVRGNQSLTGNLDVDGITTLDEVNIDTDDNTFKVEGSHGVIMDVENAITFDADNPSHFKTSVGNLTLNAENGILDLDGASAVNIGATGVMTTVEGNFNVDEAVTFDSTLTVDGSTQLNHTLDVTGITNLNNTTQSTAYTNGALVVHGGVGIYKNTNIEGTLDVNSHTTLDQVTINTDDGLFTVLGSHAVDMDVADSISLDADRASNFNTSAGRLSLNAEADTLDLDGARAVQLGATDVTTQVEGMFDVIQYATFQDSVDVDGHTTLDQVSIVTDDGLFSVTGANAVDMDIAGYLSFDADLASNFNTSVGNLTLNAESDTLDLDGALAVQIGATDVRTQVEGMFDVIQYATFQDSVDVDGHTTLDQVSIVTNDGPFAVTGSNQMDVDVTSFISLDADQASNFNTSAGKLSFNAESDTLDLDGALAVQIGATGVMTTVEGNLNVDEAVTMDSTLTVDGSTQLNHTLDVEGITNINNTTQSTAYTNGALIVHGGVGIYKKTFMEGTLDVNSHTTLDQVSIDTDDGPFTASGANQIAFDVNKYITLDADQASHFNTSDGNLSLNAQADTLDLDGALAVQIGATGVTTQVEGMFDVLQYATFQDSVDVDGHTTLDQLSVVTDDGQMAVTGSNGLDVDLSSFISLDADQASNFNTSAGNLTLNAEADTLDLDGALAVQIGAADVTTQVEGMLDVVQYATFQDSVDIDGHTTLDQVSISTQDGPFAVSGLYGINFNVNSASNYITNNGDLRIDANNGSVIIEGYDGIYLGETDVMTHNIGKMNVKQDFSVDSTAFKIEAASGNTRVGGNLTVKDASSPTAVFEVTGGSGNTYVAGTFETDGIATFNSTVNGQTANFDYVNVDKNLTSTGNTNLQETSINADLTVSDTADFSSLLRVNSSINVNSSGVGGSIRTNGGVNINQNLYVGGVAYLGGGLDISSTTQSTSYTSGALIVAGGVGIAKKLNINEEITSNSTTASTSSTTGALKVAGGAGIAGAIWAGNSINSAGEMSFNNNGTHGTHMATETVQLPGGTSWQTINNIAYDATGSVMVLVSPDPTDANYSSGTGNAAAATFMLSRGQKNVNGSVQRMSSSSFNDGSNNIQIDCQWLNGNSPQLHYDIAPGGTYVTNYKITCIWYE